jgi:hypothetical protein
MRLKPPAFQIIRNSRVVASGKKAKRKHSLRGEVES